MHRIEIPQRIRERALRVRGREHVVETLDPARTAHLIVDLQNGFVAEWSATPIVAAAARKIVSNVNRICAAMRQAGGTNVFLRYTYDPAEARPWTVRFQTYLDPRSSVAHQADFARGAEGWQLWPELDIRSGDFVVDKTRFSAFVPGTCSLEDLLRERGIDTVIVTGTVTNVCCESTARDAMQRNYKVVLVTDANAAGSDAEHNATLANLVVLFADLRTTAETVALINAARSRAAAE